LCEIYHPFATTHIAAGEQVTNTSTWQQLLENPGSSDHIAQTYQDEAFLLEAVGHYVRAGLRRGEGVVLIMRKTHWTALVAQFGTLDLPAAVERGQVASYDADEMLAGLMKVGVPDHDAFHRMVGNAIGRMRRSYPAVRAFGEMVDILWRDGRRAAAAELEKLWSDLVRTGPFALLCGYQVDPMDRAVYGGPFEALCNSHTHLIPARDYRRFDEAVNQASREVLDSSSMMMLESLAGRHKPHAEMPTGQAIIHWLSLNMPRTADKVLARARVLYSGA
jgi:hypothetical protein